MPTVYTATPVQAQSPWMAGENMMMAAYFELTTGLANGDTIIVPNMVTPSGVIVTRVQINFTPLDTNVSPTGTFSFGDNQTDTYAAARFMTGVKMGGTANADGLLHAFSNVAPTLVSGVQVEGIGYYYMQDQQTAGTNGGFWNGVLTVTAAPATAAATGTVLFVFEYACAGTQ